MFVNEPIAPASVGVSWNSRMISGRAKEVDWKSKPSRIWARATPATSSHRNLVMGEVSRNSV